MNDSNKRKTDAKTWDQLILGASPRAHYMQSAAWAEAKSQFYWPVTRHSVPLKDGDFPVQLFSRNVPGMGRMHYLPEAVGITPNNLPTITTELRKQYAGKGLAIKLELYQPRSDELIAAFERTGWKRARSVQHRTTVLADLRGTEDEVFARLKSRARYEVRASQRHGVTIERAELTPENFDIMSKLIDVTAKRSGGYFRSRSYLTSYWQAFAKHNQASLYFARHEGDILAGAFVITYGQTAWYKDGGSIREKSNLLAPRLIHWQIIRDLREQGVETYDLSGIPAPEDRETSPLKGLYTFKTGFAADITRLMPAMELPLGRLHGLWPRAEKQVLRINSRLRGDFWY